MKKILSTILALAAFYNPLIAYDLSICSIFQNEAPYMKEWIEFHRLVGVQHFYLYNNNSTDNFREVLAPYIEEGIVDLIEWTQVDTGFKDFCFVVQVSAFNDAVQRAKYQTRWMIHIDLDEFIFSPMSDNLVTLLDGMYSLYGGVVANWQCYGTSHVPSIGPDELMIEKLVLKAPTLHPQNSYFKSIIQPWLVVNFASPHHCKYVKGSFAVRTNMHKANTESKEIVVDTLRINHYWSRDEHFFNEVKIPRYMRWESSKEGIVATANAFNQVYDDSIMRFVPALKERMKNAPK